MTSTQPANVTHDFSVCDVSSMESRTCTVLREAIRVCSHLNSVGWRGGGHLLTREAEEGSCGAGGLMSCARAGDAVNTRRIQGLASPLGALGATVKIDVMDVNLPLVCALMAAWNC